ncbi:PGG domain [Dillenia turbinata]|uniref:PGG domain n=1 Tax=Dillenia turbinata TaxID=194707 RepID=A0AAN8ZDM0_9MAGN
MDSRLYKAIMEGKIEILREFEKEYEVQITANKNTVLHIAAQFGHIRCVEEIILRSSCTSRRSLLLQQNANGETALLLASRQGSRRIVHALIDAAKSCDHPQQDVDHEVGDTCHSASATVRKMISIVDNKRNTCLHWAVKYYFVKVVNILLAACTPDLEDQNEQSYWVNEAGETPLYLAAERGYADLVSAILDNCKSPANQGPGGRTALHAAVINNDEAMVEKLLEKKVGLIKEADQDGWTSLHYAVRLDFKSQVRLLIAYDKSVAYVKDNNGRTALQIGAIHGKSNAMRMLIDACPDCIELVDNEGRNVLHNAIKHKHLRAANCILKSSFSSLDWLLNGEDNDGNTPCHLAALDGLDCEELVNSSRVDYKAMNKQDLTPLDVALQNKDNLIFLSMDDGVKGKRRVSKEVGGKKSGEQDVKTLMEASNYHLVVAALIATVTFAAGFTLPGGLYSDPDHLPGTPILVKKAAFQAFVIMNALANLLSVSALFIYFILFMLGYREKRPFERAYYLAGFLTSTSIAAMMVAFATGINSVLHKTPGLAIVACLISCSFFILHVPFSLILFLRVKPARF